MCNPAPCPGYCAHAPESNQRYDDVPEGGPGTHDDCVPVLRMSQAGKKWALPEFPREVEQQRENSNLDLGRIEKRLRATRQS